MAGGKAIFHGIEEPIIHRDGGWKEADYAPLSAGEGTSLTVEVKGGRSWPDSADAVGFAPSCESESGCAPNENRLFAHGPPQIVKRRRTEKHFSRSRPSVSPYNLICTMHGVQIEKVKEEELCS